VIETKDGPRLTSAEAAARLGVTLKALHWRATKAGAGALYVAREASGACRRRLFREEELEALARPAPRPSPSRSPRAVPAGQAVFTTGEVARLCAVSTRTAAGWFDSGKLGGFRIPGSQDRRIPRASLLRFLAENGMPLGALAAWRVVAVTADAALLAGLAAALPGVAVEPCGSWYDAGALLACPSAAAVLDDAMGASDCAAVARRLLPSGRPVARVLAEDAADPREPRLMTARHPLTPAGAAALGASLLARMEEVANGR
jgi:two-component system response regulator RpaA